jgi:transketolase
MRNSFIEELVLQADNNERIALIVGDLGYSIVEPFAEKFPDRFINAGIAEQNMMGMAAGMASEGYHVFVYSIANFPTFRCAEQIRNDIAYHNLPVTIVAVGGGLGYGSLGYSHHAVQDYALMRIMPGMLIAAPGDSMETKASVRYLLNNPQPSYLRLGKSGENSIHKEIPNLNPGEWLKISCVEEKINNKKAILSTGATLAMGNLMARDEKYQDYDFFSVPLWGMDYKKIQQNKLRMWDEIITLEDHLLDGGFCSWLLEAMLTLEKKPKIISKALDQKICGMVGEQNDLNKIGGLFF